MLRPAFVALLLVCQTVASRGQDEIGTAGKDGPKKRTDQGTDVPSQSQPIPASPPIPVPILSANEHKWNAYTEARTEPENKFLGLGPDDWVAFWTFGLCCVTLVLAVATYRLYRATVDMGADAKEAATVRANETAAALAEAKRSADAARDLVTNSEKNAERQLRAYVSIRSTKTMKLEATERPKILLELYNSGKTPAHHVVMRFELAFGDQTAMDFSPDRLSSLPPVDMAPDVGMPMIEEMPRILSAEMIGAIRRDKNVSIFAHGDIRYRDAFNFDRKTTFRLKVNPEHIGPGQCGHGLALCDQGNRIE
jgi:hypothetical protein